jgi:hypothetical protein
MLDVVVLSVLMPLAQRMLGSHLRGNDTVGGEGSPTERLKQPYAASTCRSVVRSSVARVRM